MKTKPTPDQLHPRQAIVTRYFGPTNFRGSRIKASAAAGSCYVEYDDALNYMENHYQAAVKLIDLLDWLDPINLISAGLPNGTDYVWVFKDQNTTKYIYTCYFVGRLKDAIGIRHVIHTTVESDTKLTDDEVKLKLYGSFDHISDLRVKEHINLTEEVKQS